MPEVRTDRELETREKKTRRRSWVRPEVLPSPNPEPGYEFRWVRVSSLGQGDPKNITAKLREGWEPVRAVDHPEIVMMATEDDRYKDNIVIGGLMLCKTPTELVQERNEFYRGEAENQITAVDQTLMRNNDPRMPLFKERKSTVSFGTGS